MQLIISIPHGWDYPRFTFGQLTTKGVVIGLIYYQKGTHLAEEFGEAGVILYYRINTKKNYAIS